LVWTVKIKAPSCTSSHSE